MKMALRLLGLFVILLLLFAGQDAYACAMHESSLQLTKSSVEKNTVEKDTVEKHIVASSAYQNLKPLVRMSHDSGCCVHGVSVCCMLQSSYFVFSLASLPLNGKISHSSVSFYSLTVSPSERPPTI